MLDALMASVLMAVALLSLGQLLIQTNRATAASGRTTMATLLATQKIEELRASPPAALERGTDAPAPGFAREWSMTALPSDPGHLAVVEVRVRAAGVETRIGALQPRREQ